MLTRRHLIALSATQTFALNLLVREANAQTSKSDYPNRPVRFIVPVAAGGPTDLVARMLAEKLSKMWDQQVFIENKGGAGTNIGNEYAARADPDGYTALFATSSLAVNTSLYRSLSYDPIADFAPVSLVTQLAYFVFVPNSSPAKTMKEFIAHAKANPGKLTMASPGTGSAPFLAEMVFLQMANIQMTHVPYRGASPAFADLIPGRVDCYFGSGALLVLRTVRAGTRFGHHWSETRCGSPGRADRRAGRCAGLRRHGMAGVVRSSQTPAEIVRKISANTRTALIDPAIQEKLTKTGYVGGGSSPEALAHLLKSEIVKWSGVIKSVGIRIE